MKQILQVLQVFVIMIIYSALISFMFPMLYDFVNGYTKQGRNRELKLEFLNTFIVNATYLVLFFIIYGLIIKPLIFKQEY